MNKRFLKAVSLASAAIMLTGALAGCGEKETAQSGEGVDFKGYPMNSSETLTWWCSIDANLTTTYNTLNESEYAKAMEEQIGVDIDFTHPAVNGGGDQFNLMLASGELPDIIEHYWVDFPGGAGKAIEDGYIIPLNDVIDKYMPNVKKFMEENPDLAKYFKTDDGTIFSVPGMTEVHTPNGMIIRQDWLDDLGLDTPETLDDWYNVLKAFKEEKGAKAPLSSVSFIFNAGALSGPYGLKTGWYIDGDEVKYGFAEPAYKDYITEMNKWYNEGLIDKNIFSVDGQIVNSNFLNGVSGATFNSISSGIGTYLNTLGDNSDMVIKAVPYPVMNKGEKAKHTPYDNTVNIYRTAISTSCENVELAARTLDWLYSEEGMMLVNYGVEGKSYEMVDGEPQYTDEVLNNPEGLTVNQAISKYARPFNTCYSMLTEEAYKKRMFSDVMRDAFDVFHDTESYKTTMPPLYPTAEEQKELSELTNALDTYCSEMLAKFITGVTPISEFDKYTEELKKLKVDRVIEIKQAAYDRFLKR